MTLRPNQIAHAAKLPTMPAALLLDEPGAGKTATTLTAIQSMGGRYRTLVVAPYFVAQTVWEQEAEKWTPELKVSTVIGPPAARVKKLNANASVFVINYENVRWLYDQWLEGKTPKFDIMVLDEITRVKNISGKTYERIRNLGLNATWRWGLTATPVGTSLLNLYGQVAVLGRKDLLGHTYTEYKHKFFFPTDMYGYTWEPRKAAPVEIYESIKGICLRSLVQTYESKNYTVKRVQVPLTRKLMNTYKDARRELVLELDTPIVFDNAAIATNKLMQFTSGAMYYEENYTRAVAQIHDLKIDACMETLDSLQGAPCLLVYHYNHEVDRLKIRLEEKGIEYAVLAEFENAVETIHLFNRGEIPVLLIHPKSAGHGLNLQYASHHMIILTGVWSQEAWVQLIGRLARTGQRRTVRVHYLICPSTVDAVQDKVCQGRIKTNEELMNEVLS